jgi:uncharacterized protein (TIGR03083 family)
MLRLPPWERSRARPQPKTRARPGLRTRRIPLDPRHDNPFPVYDREIARLGGHLDRLDDARWSRASNCRGWTVKDVVAHLSTDEVYNQACLDNRLGELPFGGSLTSWNQRGVRIRRGLSPLETRQEWEARQRRVRQAWEGLGLDARIRTSVGRYPLILQVWHLAREYAIHADDIGVGMPAGERREQLRWRAAFGLFAAEEEGEPLEATMEDDHVRLQHDGRGYELDLETFVAYLTNRPQQLKDAKKRALVRKLT